MADMLDANDCQDIWKFAQGGVIKNSKPSEDKVPEYVSLPDWWDLNRKYLARELNYLFDQRD